MNDVNKVEGIFAGGQKLPSIEINSHNLSIDVYKNNSKNLEDSFIGSIERAKELMGKRERQQATLPLTIDAQSFPFEALGTVAGPAAKYLHETIQAPDSVCGLSILATMALVTQAYANVDMGHGIYPINLYCMSVAESGERKSAIDKIVVKPIKEWQKHSERTYQKEFECYKKQLAVWEKTYKEVLNSVDADVELKKLKAKPTAPLKPYMICEEPTYEALVELFTIGQPTLGIFSDEGGRLLGGQAFSSENKLKTAAGLSTIWDGSEITRARKGDGFQTLYGKRLSVHLLLQEIVIKEILQEGLLEKQGFLARFLLVQPNGKAGSRKYIDENPEKNPLISDFKEKVDRILDNRLPIDPNSILKNELEPRIVCCDPLAKALWINYYNEVEKQEGKGGKYSSIKSFASKSPEQACRIAGILALFDNLEIDSIKKEHMQRAVNLARFFLDETLRIFSEIETNLVKSNSSLLLEWLKKELDSQKSISRRKIMQFGPYQIRKKASLNQSLEFLVDNGCIRIEDSEIYLNSSKEEI